ncbi:MAG: hypothetical protein ACPIG6_08725 [Akkermansiaceae bacterium]
MKNHSFLLLLCLALASPGCKKTKTAGEEPLLTSNGLVFEAPAFAAQLL